jgi:hypothetical protein
MEKLVSYCSDLQGLAVDGTALVGRAQIRQSWTGIIAGIEIMKDHFYAQINGKKMDCASFIGTVDGATFGQGELQQLFPGRDWAGWTVVAMKAESAPKSESGKGDTFTTATGVTYRRVGRDWVPVTPVTIPKPQSPQRVTTTNATFAMQPNLQTMIQTAIQAAVNQIVSQAVMGLVTPAVAPSSSSLLRDRLAAIKAGR